MMWNRRVFLLTVTILCLGYIAYSLYVMKVSRSYLSPADAAFQVTASPGLHISQTKVTPRPVPLSTFEPFENSTSEEEELKKLRTYTNTLPNNTEVSVVTAYFNIGRLQKMSSEGPYTPDLYKKWMEPFSRLNNTLFVFTDNNDTANHFRNLRAHFSPDRTKIFVLAREQLWAFRLKDEIQKIYSTPGYPKHPPNTINPLYSCAMHAKFEVIQTILQQHLHKNRFIAWLDIGLFRAEVGKKETIHLTVPKDFDRTKVGYSRVNGWQDLKPMDIVRGNKVWVGGASFMAAVEVAYKYCSDYRRTVRKLLDIKIMSTDQQVIYSMYQSNTDFKPRVQIQTYTNHHGHNPWFYMGYAMKFAP